MPTEAAHNNPSPFTPSPPPPHVPPSTNTLIRAAACVWADWAIEYRSHFTYTEGAGRAHMFNSKPGSLPQSADCSQFCAALLHWAGVKHGLQPPQAALTPTDYTGTLLQKGKHNTVAQVRPGDLIVYGPGTGTHAVFVRERINATDFWVISHGHQGDPSRLRHSTMAAWMRDHGHKGVTFLSFLL